MLVFNAWEDVVAGTGSVEDKDVTGGLFEDDIARVPVVGVRASVEDRGVTGVLLEDDRAIVPDSGVSAGHLLRL